MQAVTHTDWQEWPQETEYAVSRYSLFLRMTLWLGMRF